jgi:lipopolysaccharide/colanic/teichoic acid biosynthesis glycosyltransferase
VKRVFDICTATIVLLALCPLFVAIALAIMWDAGRPVLFWQQRVGRLGTAFQIAKFRSMRESEATGPLVTAGGDLRVTRVGTILRRYKLDELPQLWNVLKGEMSIVGPRPEVSRYVNCWSDAQRRSILQVRPGITDPASVKFRNEESLLQAAADSEAYYVQSILPQKLVHYESYVANQSFAGDLKIIGATLMCVISRT